MKRANDEKSDFDAVFQRLRAILQKHQGKCSINADTPTHFSLQAGLHPKHKTPMSVAWVEIGKNYVSYHLMAVYGFPKLLHGHDNLKTRMQGKSCFNFKKIDEALFSELEQLTVAGFEAWKKAGFAP